MDQHLHRFLWRDYEDRAPDTYIKLELTTGDKPAPPMAIIAMNLTAEENEEKYTKAATTKRYTYMDNILDSLPTRGEAIEMTCEIDTVLETGHFTRRVGLRTTI